jgi:hypothetical protein
MLNHQGTTCQIVKHSEETGSVFDKCAKEHKCSISTHIEVVGEAREAIREVQEKVCNF